MENHTHNVTSQFIIGKSEIKCSADIKYSRQLTYDEERIISKAFETLANILYKNDLKNNQEYQKNLADEKRKILDLFGDKRIYVSEIENEYTPDALNPWFNIVTTKGHVKIGWRKRVIQIEWNTKEIPVLAKDVCPDDDVTRTTGWSDKNIEYIHAWGYEKAQEYLNVILK